MKPVMRSPALLQAAIAYQQAGELGEARKLYEQMLRGDPRNTDAMHLLGLLLIELGTAEKGFQLLRRAAVHAPRSAEVLNNLAIELCRIGKFDEALAYLDRVVALSDAPQTHFNRARALRDAGRREDALAAYDRVIALDPRHVGALSDRGAVLAELGRTEDAIAMFDAALRVAPDNADGHYNKGNALNILGRTEQALAAYDAALAAGSKATALLVNRGIVLCKLGRRSEAQACYEAALSSRPDDPDALFNFGVLLRALRRPVAAIACFDGALAARTDFPEALDERGGALSDLRRHEEAAETFTALVALRPRHPYALGRMHHARMLCGAWSGFAATSAEIAERVAADEPVDVPFSFLAHAASAALQLRCASHFVARNCPAQATRPPPRPRAPDGRIRLAYLSADFRAHPMVFLMAGVFEQHDRTRFETVAISFDPPDDGVIARRLRLAFDRFVDVSDKTDGEVVALMRDMRIAVAIDLMGHTADSRTAILAQRAAPVQIAYLGYPGTMGAPYVDAIIADGFVIPPGSERFYTERVIRLPGCFQANDDRRHADAAPARSAVDLPESGFVFCAFSNTMKLNPTIFDVWMRLLDEVPGSVLWLLAETAAARTNLAAAAVARGVHPARLVFAPRVTYPAHLGRLKLADIFLDTFPFNGGSTVSDALWAGVPTVTCAGEAFASRMAGSLLSAAGLPDLIAADLLQYKAIALRLAGDEAALADAKKRLQQGRSHLFDTQSFCRSFEAALLTDLAI